MNTTAQNRNATAKPKLLWIVSTHLGDFRTWATSARRAIANVRYRLAGTGCNCSTVYWKAVIAS